MNSQQLIDALRDYAADHGLEAYVVGGFVRDALLGRPVSDVDLAVPDATQSLARDIAAHLDGRLVPLDAQQRVFRIVVHGEAADGSPQTWHVDLSTTDGGVEADLARRDFTVNALAVPAALAGAPATDWHLIDPFHGRADLTDGVLRVVGPDAIASDPVRGLRAVRLAAQLGFAIDADTQRLIAEGASGLAAAAPERVRDELLDILAQPAVLNQLRLLDALGLLDAVLPELAPARGVSQPVEHYWDVFDHSLHTAEMVERVLEPAFRAHDDAGRCIPWEPWLDDHFAEELSDGHPRSTWLRLAGLLHDVAKPQTKRTEPSGRVRFLGHTTLGAEMTEGLLHRLRVSNRGVRTLAAMVESHLRPSQLAQKGEVPTSRAVYRFFRELDDAAADTLYLSLADFLAARGPDLPMDEWQGHCDRVAYALQHRAPQDTLRQAPRLLDGHDLMRVFSLEPGPRFRPLLEMVREAQATGAVSTRDEALALVERTLRHVKGEPVGGRHD